MPLDVPAVRQRLIQFDFKALFTQELGWDFPSGGFDVAINNTIFRLDGIADKRGVRVLVCHAPDGVIPDYALRRKIEKEVMQRAFEHLIIFIDGGMTTQIWQWVARQPGMPAACREHSYRPGTQSGELLVQKLKSITIPLSEEEAIDLTGTIFKLRDAFDRDRLTKQFYNHFKREHGAFLDFIKGVTEQGDAEWYASLMLNRLMFVYFIQKQGFLDGNINYLRDRLRQVQELKGKGEFQTFYRLFLLNLFHEGFGKQRGQRNLSPDLVTLLGEVPYLNGGLFDVHELERKHADIDVPDEAFQRLFAFFDQYDWHLDTRPLASGKEINPDVLGYIFEQYINNIQMGAYYTKEDITDYISKNTIIPYLFDVAKSKTDCTADFAPDSTVWRQLKENPDRYLYPAVRQGVIDLQNEIIPLPGEIEKGIDDIKQRAGWNKPAAAPFALPTETWREYVARRQRCLGLRDKLVAGTVHQINDLITFNLDIRQFAADSIVTCDRPELLRALYHAISTVTVLDPTCGSGAFLFAALNILEPLYEACLDRMQAFVDDFDRDHPSTKSNGTGPKKYSDFRKILAEVAKHPSRSYFVFKSIIVHNLYGVDIMEEAVEICKLRLFLKLVSQVERVQQLEPLPDIDFNIRAGNTLVGYASLDAVKQSLKGTLGFGKGEVKRIEEEAKTVDSAFDKFHQMQTNFGMDATAFAESKRDLRQRLDALAQELDLYLSKDYCGAADNSKTFSEWQKSHKPFHWFTEFYGIMCKGGFDVIVGNPPYLERSKLNGVYSVNGLKTQDCRDIYAWCVERAIEVSNVRSRLGLIVPVSIVSSENFLPLRQVVGLGKPTLWLSHFANRPGQLFFGAQNRLTIIIRTASDASRTFSTRYHRWDARNGERDVLFSRLTYAELPQAICSFHHLLPKVGTFEGTNVLRSLLGPRTIGNLLVKHSAFPVYWVRVPGYFCQFFLTPPMARPEAGGEARQRGEVNVIYCSDERTRRLLHAILNSSTWYQFFCAFTDGRHVNPTDVKDFPCDLNKISMAIQSNLIAHSHRIEETMTANTTQWRKSGLLIDSVDSRATKPILDAVDTQLAAHFGFGIHELDFVINYDIKYRMGQEDASECE